MWAFMPSSRSPIAVRSSDSAESKAIRQASGIASCAVRASYARKYSSPKTASSWLTQGRSAKKAGSCSMVLKNSSVVRR